MSGPGILSLRSRHNMNDDLRLQHRLVELEERFTHQESLLHELNNVIVLLRDDVDRLEAKCDKQQQVLTWLLQNFGGIEDNPDEKPPHY